MLETARERERRRKKTRETEREGQREWETVFGKWEGNNIELKEIKTVRLKKSTRCTDIKSIISSIWGQVYTSHHITQIKQSNLGDNCLSPLQSSCLNNKALAHNSLTITLRRKLHGTFYSCSLLTPPHALYRIIFTVPSGPCDNLTRNLHT